MIFELLKLHYLFIFLLFARVNICVKIGLNGTLISCKPEDENKDKLRYRLDLPVGLTPTLENVVRNCRNKIRLTLSIYNEGKISRDEEFVMVNSVYDVETKTQIQLLTPLVIKIIQGPVLLAYPFHFLTAVNEKASEMVATKEYNKNDTVCDVKGQVTPTCEVQHRNGKRIPFSEGFCCSCSNSKGKLLRGNQTCEEGLEIYNASTHCLKFSKHWYTVNSLEHPTIEHTLFMNFFLRWESPSNYHWWDLTHQQKFTIGSHNNHEFNCDKTVIAAYVAEKPNKKSITIDYENKRLLIPEPLPGLTSGELPPRYARGSSDYLILSKDLIEGDGTECDKAGVGYRAFFHQSSRCEVPPGTCLKNQPLDLWNKDDKKLKAGKNGSFLLRFYGTPHRDSILINKTTGQHWLALEYTYCHLTIVHVEIDARNITVLQKGHFAQLLAIVTSSTAGTSQIYVQVLNTGLVAARFTAKAVQCSEGVSDSSEYSEFIPPQSKKELFLFVELGSMDIRDNIVCTVKLRSENVEHVAERQVVLKPKDRCICFMHCKCTCIKDSLSCKLMTLEDYHKAGFRGSLPVLHTLKYHHNFTILFIIIVVNILFLIIGFTKAAGGVILNRRVATFGIEFLVYRPKLLRQYIDKTLQEKYEMVEYNEEGYPVHPETKEHVRVTTIYEELLLNLFIVYLSPVLLIYFLSKRKRENSGYIPINQQSEDEISDKTSDNSPDLPHSEA